MEIVVLRKDLVLVVLTCLFAASCSGGADQLDTVPAAGTVSIDGLPFGPGSLDLIPLDASDRLRSAVASVDENGAFVVTTYEEGDGIIPGTYTVHVNVDVAHTGAPPPNVQPIEVTIGPGGDSNLFLSLESREGTQGTLLSPDLDSGGASTDL